MGDFKRSSTRFSRGGGSEGGNGGGNSGGGSQGGGRSFGGNRGGSGGGNGGGRSYGGGSRGGQGGGEGKSFPFSRVANLTIPKSAPEDMVQYIHEELKGSEIRFNAQIYLGKGDNELNLKNGDMLLISFKVSEKDKNFVVGNVSVKN